jgi:post-segregation antitoxin (ccd killing protein)
MTLTEFLQSLKTLNVTALVKDLRDVEICKISASSVTALADDLETRTINRWLINGATSITIVLNDEVISA